MIAPLACVLLAALCAPRAVGVSPGEAAAFLPAAAAPAFTRTVATRSGRTPATVQPAKGRFLIAGRNLLDPNFAETVVLLLDYDVRGAMGIVINRPTAARLASALPDIQELRDRPDRVHLGGPVAGNLMLLLVRSATTPQSSQRIFDDVYATGSLTVLRQVIGKTGKTARVRGYAGHAGWGPGQLDREIARGDWHVSTADAGTVFDTAPSEVWSKLIERFSGQWTRKTEQEEGALPAKEVPGVVQPSARRSGGGDTRFRPAAVGVGGREGLVERREAVQVRFGRLEVGPRGSGIDVFGERGVVGENGHDVVRDLGEATAHRQAPPAALGAITQRADLQRRQKRDVIRQHPELADGARGGDLADLLIDEQPVGSDDPQLESVAHVRESCSLRSYAASFLAFSSTSSIVPTM
jgi:putative transcriptional regulator